jgi:hypothetical protein
MDPPYNQVPQLPSHPQPQRNYNSLWTTSLLQFLHKHNLQLARGGNPTTQGPNEPLIDYLLRQGYSSAHLTPTLTLHNIHTVSDAFNRQTHRWSPTIKQLLQSASPLAPLPNLPTSLEPTSIRIGQLWHTHAPCITTPPYQDAAPHGVVFEIRGWINDDIIAVQLWTCKNPMCSITSARRLYLATPSQGAGSTHVLHISEAFSASSAPFTQFITAPDRRTRLHGHAAISAEVISTTSHTTVLLKKSTLYSFLNHQLCDFTDLL